MSFTYRVKGESIDRTIVAATSAWVEVDRNYMREHRTSVMTFMPEVNDDGEMQMLPSPAILAELLFVSVKRAMPIEGHPAMVPVLDQWLDTLDSWQLGAIENPTDGGAPPSTT